MTRLAVSLASPEDRAGFWTHASLCRQQGLHPSQVSFGVAGETGDLFGTPGAMASGRQEPAAHVAAFRERYGTPLTSLIDTLLLHCDPERFNLAYRLLTRSDHDPHTPSILSDPDVARARDLEKSVRRDLHKMTAFVRFRAQPAPAERETFPKSDYIAWFEPEHHIVRAVAPFFVRRFTSMRWSILTPRTSAHWDGATLSFSTGSVRADAPASDPLEDVWRTYYGSIFNPARLKPKAMQAQMPKKYWHNLPEARLIAPLIAEAQQRSANMIAAQPTSPRVARAASPALESRMPAATLPDLAMQVAACTRCPLHCHATQAVAGEGPHGARMMIVGEQPGDEEDLAGRPFIGPAGRLLDEALRRSGIDRGACYVTNAVKHFKFEPRGKRRLHKSPNVSEIDQCRWWINQERALIQPEVILALGATAARSILSAAVKIDNVRGHPIVHEGARVVVTAHPAYLLRLTDGEEKRRQWSLFLQDLSVAKGLNFEPLRRDAASAMF